MKESLVMFDESNHTYTIGDRRLISVTELIKKYVLPDMYSGVDQNLLRFKAGYGTDVHKRIEMLSSGFPFEDNDKYPEVVAYDKWVSEHQWVVDKSEYVVSDNELVAGTIDQVLHAGDNEYILADLKTTSVVHKEYVSWQLSLYAYLFEKQNEGKFVTELYVVHLHGDKCELVPVERIPASAIEALLECEKSGAETFANPLKATCDDAERLIVLYKSVCSELADVKELFTSLDSQKKFYEQEFSKLCEDKGQSEFQTSLAVVKKKADSIRRTFSVEKYAESCADFFKAWRPKGTSKSSVKKQEKFDADWKLAIDGGYKESVVKGGVTIKFS